MREGCLAASSHMQQQQTPSTGNSTATCNASSLNGQLVVDLPYSAQQLSALLGILYEHNLEVGGSDQSYAVQWHHPAQQRLLGMPSFAYVPCSACLEPQELSI